MKKLLVILALPLFGCASGSNTRVIEANPPWCQDYIVTDPVTGESFLRYNGTHGSTSVKLDQAKAK